MDSSIAAKRRALALQRAAEILGVQGQIPSTKDSVVVREMYLAELIAALAERAPGVVRRTK
jgi:hypothetical protein